MRRTFSLLLLSLSLPFVSLAQPLTPQDFAEGVQVTPAGSDSVQGLELPPSLYRTVTRQDLGDIRVFNAAGEAVPHTLLENDAPVLTEQELPLYPLTDETLEEALSLSIERGKASTSLQLDTAPVATPTTTYIIDQRGVNVPRQLRFEWAETPPFFTPVRLEASRDLSNWQLSDGTMTLAELRQNGLELVKDELDAPAAPYLWLKPGAGEALPPLTRVYAEVYRDPQQRTREIRVDAETSQPGSYLYDLGGPFRVVQASIYPQVADVLARVRLESAADPAGPWQVRYQGSYFDLTQNGQRLQSNPLTTEEARARYWRLTADPSDGLGGAPPALGFVTVPDTLAFVARGDPPFTLAYGSLGAEPATFDMQGLLNASAATPATFANVSAPFDLAGETALREPETFPWQSLMLWSVLIGGVALLAWLAVLLLRQGGARDGSE